jgi:single stranded DNA-binding protein
MNKVMLVGRLTRDPELRTLPSGKHVTTFTIATNEYRGQNAGERTEYHACVAWDRLAEICGQFLGKGQLVDLEGRLQHRQWDDDAGKDYCIVHPCLHMPISANRPSMILPAKSATSSRSRPSGTWRPEMATTTAP